MGDKRRKHAEMHNNCTRNAQRCAEENAQKDEENYGKCAKLDENVPKIYAKIGNNVKKMWNM